MRVQYQWMYWFLLVCLLLPDCACAQDTTPSPAYELQPIFSDNCSKDTRADYKITGDVTWEAGQLTLQPNASFARQFKAGARTRVEMTLDFPELTKEQPESELQLWIDLDAATDCFVRLRRTLTDQGETATIALFDTGEQDGKPVSVLVRESTLDNADIEQLAVEYRYGLVHVAADAIDVLAAYVQNGSAAVAGFRLTGSRTYLNLNRISASSIPASVELTDEQQVQLAKVITASDQWVELYDQGKYAEAATIAEGMLQIRTAVLGPDHFDTGMNLGILATLYNKQANYAAAEPLFLLAQKFNETVLGPVHPETAKNLNNLACLYCSQANYAAAEPLYLRSLEISENVLGRDHPDTTTSLSNLAGVYMSQANYAAVEPLLVRALQINETALGPDHPDTAWGLNNLAMVYDVQGKYTDAEPLYLRALEICEKSIGTDHPHTATNLNNLALLYKSQANYAAAEPLLLRAMEIREKALGPDHPDTAQSLNNLATLYHKQANYAAAEPLYQRALKIHEKVLGPDHPNIALSLYNLAVIEWDRDQSDTALPLMERALGIRLRHLDATSAIQTEQQQFLMSREVASDVSNWLTVSTEDRHWTSAVYRDVLVWKGLITARQQGLRQALKDDPLFADFRRVTQQLSTVALNRPLPPSDPEALVAWRDHEPELRRNWESEKAMLEVEHERLEKELAVKSVAFRERLEQRRVQPDDLVATLKAQDRPTALVDVLEYLYYGRKSNDEKDERRIAAFVVRGDQPVVRVELGSAEEIARQVTSWRESFGRKTADQDPGAELRRLVWLPLEPHLQGIETVLISPDGALAQLPWGALPGEQPGSYLLEDRALAVIPVPQMLPSLLGKARAAGPPESLLLAGDIEYGGDPGEPQDLLVKRDAIRRLRDGRFTQFQKLPAANAELASIERRYRKQVQTGKSSTLESREATEAAFREQASKHQWLHIITHGFFSPETVRSAIQSTDGDVDKVLHSDQPQPVRGENPGLLSGLVFAGANTPPEPEKDDGILTALEVAALDLNQVDAVVLSACETGLGEVAGGEGLFGLQRAFQVAGAKTVVASLWKVPDAATARLMQRFYENLWDRKLGKLEALREAQLWMMKDQSARGAELIQDAADNSRLPPEYWAAFVLSGDWR